MNCENKDNNIFVVFDTNVIKLINPDFKVFAFGETYNVFSKFITGNRLTNTKICIPRIVIEELIEQYIYEYKDSIQKNQEAYDDLVVKATKIGWNVLLKKSFHIDAINYTKYIRGKCYKYLETQKDIILINYPCNDSMSKIINRAIEKKKPFFHGTYKNKKFSDAGFKDVIFLESIIEFSKTNKGEYLIITRDSFLQETKFDVELNCNCFNYSIVTGKELVNIYKDKYKINDMSKYMNFIYMDYYREAVEEALNCKLLDISKSIKLVDIEEDTVIENVSSIKDMNAEYDITVILSEENDLIEIKNYITGEVIYEWGV